MDLYTFPEHTKLIIYKLVCFDYNVEIDYWNECYVCTNVTKFQ